MSINYSKIPLNLDFSAMYECILLSDTIQLNLIFNSLVIVYLETVFKIMKLQVGENMTIANQLVDGSVTLFCTISETKATTYLAMYDSNNFHLHRVRD